MQALPLQFGSIKIKPVHIIGGGIVLLYLLRGTFQARLINKLSSFIPSVEGFESTPYWDVTRYSWGYGTAAPGATGTITRDQAFTDMVAHLLGDYAQLSGRITRQLNVNQWAALLSFSYNLGVGNAYNLVSVINSGDDSALHTKWLKYIYAGGQVNQTLVTRRNKEWVLWSS